ncbi:MAG: lipoprotein [Rhodobacteraceae bacterium]|nr:lipoprotein [Paracoccaceae bacterium]
MRTGLMIILLCALAACGVKGDPLVPGDEEQETVAEA